MPKGGHCHMILAAAGAGARMGLPVPKQFANLGGKPVWAYVYETCRSCGAVQSATLVVPEGYEDECRVALARAGDAGFCRVVTGGASRAASVRKALAVLPSDLDIVLVQDAARPFVTAAQIEAVAQAAMKHGAAVLAVPVKDTVKTVGADGHIDGTPAREALYLAQTPQGFRRALLTEAYEQAACEGYEGTDDASYVERLGIRPVIVPGDYRNLKLTTAEDMTTAAFWLQDSETLRH